MKPIAEISALVVEAHPQMRTQLRNMLGLIGITQIGLAVSAGAAVRKLREHTYDLILCEYHLGDGQDGQHFLEDIRHHHLIPLSTLFIMVTGESMYERVVSAAELAPNDYLLKPFAPDALGARLMRALEKREAFLPVYKLIEMGNVLEAIEACRERETQFAQYAVDFLRLRGELHLAAGQPEEARQVYDNVLQRRAVPWAKLGLAKSLFMLKRYQEAEQILSALVQENELYLDAYDWLARAREAVGEYEKARSALESAVGFSPHMLRRLRHLGDISATLGDHDAASRAMAEVVRKGKYSDFRDPEDHVKLVKAQLGLGDIEAASATLRDLERNMSGLPKTPVCAALTTALVATQTGDTDRAAAALIEAVRGNDPRLGVSTQIKKELARICLEHQMDDEAAEVVMDIMRHAANDDAVEEIKSMLSALGRPHLGEMLAERIRTEVRDIMAEGAQLAQRGDYDGSVRQMIQAARKLPGNTQVLFNAALALLKHIEHLGWNERFARQAREYIDRVRVLDPGNPRLAAMAGYFQSLLKKYGVRPEQV